MQQEIPVITVVPVMGTTEEGAVDPLTEILALKDEFKKQVSITFTFANSTKNGQIGLNIKGNPG